MATRRCALRDLNAVVKDVDTWHSVHQQPQRLFHAERVSAIKKALGLPAALGQLGAADAVGKGEMLHDVVFVVLLLLNDDLRDSPLG